MEYTNVFSQCLKATELYTDVKGSNHQETFENAKKRKAKFLPIALYIVCTLIALIIAYSYFSGIENPWLRYGAVILAGIFNIPFLSYYAVWHVALKKDAPSYSQEEWSADKSKRIGQMNNMRDNAKTKASAMSESLNRTFNRPGPGQKQ